jgi:hypothetical protein
MDLPNRVSLLLEAASKGDQHSLHRSDCSFHCSEVFHTIASTIQMDPSRPEALEHPHGTTLRHLQTRPSLSLPFDTCSALSSAGYDCSQTALTLGTLPRHTQHTIFCMWAARKRDLCSLRDSTRPLHYPDALCTITSRIQPLSGTSMLPTIQCMDELSLSPSPEQ